MLNPLGSSYKNCLLKGGNSLPIRLRLGKEMTWIQSHHFEHYNWSLPLSGLTLNTYPSSLKVYGRVFHILGFSNFWWESMCLAVCNCDYAEVASYQYSRTDTKLLIGVQSLIPCFQVEILYSKALHTAQTWKNQFLVKNICFLGQFSELARLSFNSKTSKSLGRHSKVSRQSDLRCTLL